MFAAVVAVVAAGGPALALDKVTFGTNWKAQAEHGGFYQAVADGTYAKHGLDVTIRQGGPQVNHSQLLAAGKITASPITAPVAAISVGIVQGTPLLDLEYVEDSACDTDMNVVMTGAGHYVEVQGTAEGVAFTRAEMDQLLALAEKGIRELVAAQAAALAQPLA